MHAKLDCTAQVDFQGFSPEHRQRHVCLRRVALSAGLPSTSRKQTTQSCWKTVDSSTSSSRVTDVFAITLPCRHCHVMVLYNKVDSFNCCQLCSADGLWVARTDLEDALMQMMRLLARVFQRFIVQWMVTLPAHVRRHFSYAGALGRRQIFWAFTIYPGLVWRSATQSPFWGGLFRSRECSVLPCILHDLAWALE